MLVLKERPSRKKEATAKTGKSGQVCADTQGARMCVICYLALGERSGKTPNATTRQLEVIIVDANSKLIIVMVHTYTAVNK